MSYPLTIERQSRSPRSSGTGIRPACPRVGDWRRRPLRPGLPTPRRDRTSGTEEAPLPFPPVRRLGVGITTNGTARVCEAAGCGPLLLAGPALLPPKPNWKHIHGKLQRHMPVTLGLLWPK